MKNNQEIQYIKEMIKLLQLSINNALQFGDMNTVDSIQTQINMYNKKLEELTLFEEEVNLK